MIMALFRKKQQPSEKTISLPSNPVTGDAAITVLPSNCLEGGADELAYKDAFVASLSDDEQVREEGGRAMAALGVSEQRFSLG